MLDRVEKADFPVFLTGVSLAFFLAGAGAAGAGRARAAAPARDGHHALRQRRRRPAAAVCAGRVRQATRAGEPEPEP